MLIQLQEKNIKLLINLGKPNMRKKYWGVFKQNQSSINPYIRSSLAVWTGLLIVAVDMGLCVYFSITCDTGLDDFKCSQISGQNKHFGK